MEEDKNIPKSRQLYVDPALHTELKALAHFRQQDIKVIVCNLLRDALDNLERDSENGEITNLDNSGH